MQTVKQFLVGGAVACVVVKVKGKYVCARNGELGLTTSAADALAFGAGSTAKRFIDNATIDTRNANRIGAKIDLVVLGITRQAADRNSALLTK